MNILITGCAGFIGFSFSNFLLKKNKYKVYGIDIINDYYSKSLKQKRLNILRKYKKNFFFKKLNLTNNIEVDNYFKKKKFDIVIHLAAQAGVRYSIVNPRSYIDSNTNGFFNVIENCRKYNIKNFYYASSSSVYGDIRKVPFKENQHLNPKNIYSLTKKNNEEIASIFKNFYKLPSVGLRFFTVFGEWGRPDMMILKYIKSSMSNKIFHLHNNGNHKRDFTYIEDVNQILYKLIFSKKKKESIYNICSSRPTKITKILSIIDKYFPKPKIKLIGFQNADVLNTHGCKNKIYKITKYNSFYTHEEAIKKTCLWARKYNSIF